MQYSDANLTKCQEQCKIITSCDNPEERIAKLNELYKFIKQITPEYFDGVHLTEGYKYLKQALIDCEYHLPANFIIESTPNYYYGQLSDEEPKNKSAVEKIKWIVYMTRTYLASGYRKRNFCNEDLANECGNASYKTMKLAHNIGLNCKQVIIYPGFSEYPELYAGGGFHYFNIIEVDGNKYLVDCTYRQFFTTTFNNLNRIGIVDVSNCRAGIFMTMDEYRKQVATEILKNGFIEATDENLKAYLDGFAISFRNGLYYLKTNDYSYTTNYTIEDYKKFLTGMDSQIDRETEEVLGFQRTLKLIDQK